MGNKLSQNELEQHETDIKIELGPLIDPKYYDIIDEPTALDWIPNMRERGQTLKQYLNSGYTKPDARRKKIYLLPVDIDGHFFEERFYETIALYISIFYQMDVTIMNKIYLDPKAKNVRNIDGIDQYLTKDIHTLMIPKVPADAFCVMGLTSRDLYPENRWNFVFGEATYYQRVGIFSMARLVDMANHLSDIEIDEIVTQFKKRGKIITHENIKNIMFTHDTPINRGLKIITHEILHMFSIDHCIYYNCLARGIMGVYELDRIPFTLCPICTQKLYTAWPFDSQKRMVELLDFYRKNDIGEEVTRCQSIIEAGN